MKESASGDDAVVSIPAEKAWKIFTRGIRGAEAARCAQVVGDRALGEKALETAAVIG